MRIIIITRKTGNIKIEIPEDATPTDIQEILNEHEIKPTEKYTIKTCRKKNKLSEI